MKLIKNWVETIAMKKHLYILFLLLAIFACDDAEKMLTPLMPADPPPSLSMTDEFDGNTLQNPNWQWQAEPPTSAWSDFYWDVGETRDGHLFIDTEPNRNLWATDATHLLYQEIDADVFDVETKFTVRWDTSSGVTGLVVKSPADDNWVTLKFWARDAGAKGFINFQTKQAGMGPPDIPWRFGKWGDIELSLRLKKEGNTYTGWYKAAEDTEWMDIGTAQFNLTPPYWIGIYAGVAAGSGTLQTEFDYFRDNLN